MERHPGDIRLLYRYAWVCNRMEIPLEALPAALSAWTAEPSNPWFMAEYLRALKDLEMYAEILMHGVHVRGGGVCRYYLAVAEREQEIHPSPSLLFLAEASSAEDDSTAADALLWMALLLRDHVSPDSVLALLEKAVELMPDEAFYRCVLAGDLAASGNVEGAREQVHRLRLMGSDDHSYWNAAASLAEAEGDTERRIWALERAMEKRSCPAADRNLGWALYFAGRDALREGDLNRSRARLTEASILCDSSEVFVQRSDSLLRLINEFEELTSAGD